MNTQTIKRKNNDASVVKYVQLANNVKNKKKGFAQAQITHSFSLSEQLDVEALKRLIKSMSRFLDPEDAVWIDHKDDNLKIISSRQAGGAYLLKALWNRLRIDTCLQTGLEQLFFFLSSC